MKSLILFTLLLIPLTSHASQLVPHYLPLNSVSCAILVSITSYTIKENILKGSVKKTWGVCMDKATQWTLWRPVEWRDPGVSPIEVSYQEASRRRDFKAGEEIILIQGHGWETFEVTPEMMDKLSYIFDRKTYLAKVMKDGDEKKLAELLSDAVTQEEVFKLLHDQKKLSPSLALRAHILSQKRYNRDFARMYLATLSSADKLKFIDAVSKSAEYKALDQGPYRLGDLLGEMEGEKFPAWKIAVSNMSPDVEAENEFRQKFFFNEGKEYLKTKAVDRKWFTTEWMKTIKGKRTSTYGDQLFGLWDEFPVQEKKALYPEMVPMLFKNLDVKQSFYDIYVFQLLTEEFEDFWSDPRYLELVDKVWTDKRFFNEERSDDYFLFEKILKQSQKNKAFLPALKRMNEAAKTMKKKYPFQAEVDKALAAPSFPENP